MVDEIDDEEAENCYKHKMQNAGEFIGNQGVIMQYVNSLQNQ
jgi:L-lysine 2,3-aminomutase